MIAADATSPWAYTNSQSSRSSRYLYNITNTLRTVSNWVCAGLYSLDHVNNKIITIENDREWNMLIVILTVDVTWWAVNQSHLCICKSCLIFCFIPVCHNKDTPNRPNKYDPISLKSKQSVSLESVSVRRCDLGIVRQYKEKYSKIIIYESQFSWRSIVNCQRFCSQLNSIQVGIIYMVHRTFSRHSNYIFSLFWLSSIWMVPFLKFIFIPFIFFIRLKFKSTYIYTCEFKCQKQLHFVNHCTIKNKENFMSLFSISCSHPSSSGRRQK